MGEEKEPECIACEDTGYEAGMPGWFAKHAGHRVVVRDEYGGIMGDCGSWFGCDVCGHKGKRCVLPEGHDGEHSDKRPVPSPSNTDER
jgi:hypothetical protein